MLRTVLMARPLLRAYEAGLLRRGGRAYRRFAFLSYDAIIDADGRAWVEEVNTNGFLMGTRIPRGWDYTLDAMRLLGVGGYASRPYQPRSPLQARLDRCDDEPWHLWDLPTAAHPHPHDAMRRMIQLFHKSFSNSACHTARSGL